MYQDTVNVGPSTVTAVFGAITDIRQNMRKRTARDAVRAGLTALLTGHASSALQFNPAHYPEGMWGMAYAALNAAGAAPLFDVLVRT